jgi:hypothetical protein
MKLHQITEAYDKNLALKVAKQIDVEPARLKEIVVDIDGPNLPNGVWVLKQISKNNDIGVRIQRRLKAALDKFAKVQSKLTEKDLNKYDLDSLETSIAGFTVDQPTNIHPISGQGITYLKEYRESPDITYYAYAFYDPESLAKWSCGSGEEGDGPSWCVRNEHTAQTHLRTSPQIMIFKNNNPTTLFALDRSQIKNSGNVDETRPEILKIVEDIITNHGNQIKAERQNHLTAFERILDKVQNDPENSTPDKLTQEERTLLLSNTRKAVYDYVRAYARPENGPARNFPDWPELEQQLLSKADITYNDRTAAVYFAYKANPVTKPVLDYFNHLSTYHPYRAITCLIIFTNMIKDKPGHDKMQQITKDQITDFCIKNPQTKDHQPAYTDKKPTYLALLDDISTYIASGNPIPEYEQWLLTTPIKNTTKRRDTDIRTDIEAAKYKLRESYQTNTNIEITITEGPDYTKIRHRTTYQNQYETYTIGYDIDDRGMLSNLLVDNAQEDEISPNHILIEANQRDMDQIDKILDNTIGDITNYLEPIDQQTKKYNITATRTTANPEDLENEITFTNVKIRNPQTGTYQKIA